MREEEERARDWPEDAEEQNKTDSDAALKVCRQSMAATRDVLVLMPPLALKARRVTSGAHSLYFS
jgi:hypothetical protein